MAARQSLKQKIVVNLVIPTLLLSGWLGLVFYQAFQIEKVFTVLTREYPRSAVLVLPEGEIYQGTKIKGEFTATDNYLGIVGFRFWTFYRLNDDYLIFRIKDKNSLDWYYQNRYKADQFQPNQYFTFGFPVIPDSKGKSYIFEIESSVGRPGVAVGVSEVNPTFIVKYKYPRQFVTSSSTQFVRFASTKLVNLLSKAEFKASSFIYLIPFLIYIVSLTPAYYSLENKFKIFLRDRTKFTSQLITATNMVIMITGSVLDSLFVKTGDMTIIALLILWIYLIYKYKFTDKLFFVLALVFLGMSAVFYYLNFPIASERFGAWAWIFLTIMVAINMIRLKIMSAKRTKNFISRVFSRGYYKFSK